MKIGGKHYRSVWPIGEDAFGIIDQTRLPHVFETMTLRSADDAARVIKNMNTRGAPLIGVVGAYGLALAVREDASDDNIQKMVEMLAETRPTADARRAFESAARKAQPTGLERSRSDRR
jgi:methylthioribose-1-phosphate isomerase